MGTLQAALSWARRGFSVFPLREFDKEPIHDAWYNFATTDEAKIRAMWTDPVLGTEREYNIGTLCTDMVVIDIDVKKGKDGYNEYAALGGHYDTLVVQTPTGGFHCYFHAPDSSNAPLSRSIDVRSHNGYVVAPGSRLPGYGTEEYKVINDRPMDRIPEHIRTLLKPPHVRPPTEAEIDYTVDSEAAIQAAIGYLQSAPVAIEGQRGDETTFITAARLVRELGLSGSAAFCLMRDYWNERCLPPWPLEMLAQKVENATQYGSASAGRLVAEFLFDGIPDVMPKMPTVFDQLNIDFGNAIVPGQIRPRPWLVERMLMREAVTILMAAGSAGKSSVSLALAAHVALGLDFAGFHTRAKVKVMVYNGEDDLEEQSRRLQAVCMVYELDYEEVKKNIMLLSSKQTKLDLVSCEFRKPTRNEAIISHIIQRASAPDVGLLILDPLVKIHKCDESDNVQMDFVMETLTDIASSADVAVMALHHTTKGGNSSQEARIGNMDIGRGASAIVNAARVAFTLLNASASDAEDYGFEPEERHAWVRLDDAKMNLSLASDKATWFHKEGQKIMSGDIVGVLKHDVLQKSKVNIRLRVGRTLIQNMITNGVGSYNLTRICAILKQQEPLWANLKDADIKSRVEGMFSTPVEIDGHTLHVARTMNEKTKKDDVLFTVR